MEKNKKLAKKVNTCRICTSKNLDQIIDLGETPPANSFLTKKQLKEKELFFPLKVNFCHNCGQLQLTHSVSPDLLFVDYLYTSSTSPVFINHFKYYAQDIYKKLSLNKNSFVVDVGSNDGILLKPFKEFGVKILGIDPAIKIAKEASNEGLPTLPVFFNNKESKKLKKTYGSADVICANNVFAHVTEIDEIVKGVQHLLKKDGVFVIEFPYLIHFYRKNLFDTIYHEHVSYLSIKPLITLFNRFDLEIFDVDDVSSHGGSTRVYVKKSQGKWRVKTSVKHHIDLENKLNIHKITTWYEFSKKIDENRQKLLFMLNRLKTKNKKIAGYGAPAKGNTLLNYFKINNNILDYIVDDSPLKQGLYTPGTHIPVVHRDMLKQNTPDYLFLLAWNFAKPIMNNLTWYKNQKGKFIIPVPAPKIF